MGAPLVSLWLLKVRRGEGGGCSPIFSEHGGRLAEVVRMRDIHFQRAEQDSEARFWDLTGDGS